MDSFSVIWHLFLLINVQLPVWRVGATITWTEPTPPYTPVDESKIRTTTQGFKSSVSKVQLEWQFTVSPGKLKRVTWSRDGDVQVIGEKEPNGKLTIGPKFKTEFSISPSDQATLVTNNVTAADGKTFQCEVALSDLTRWRDKIKVVIYEQTQFTDYSGDQVINEDSDLPLFCNTTGKPTATVNWTRVLNDGSNDDIMFVGNPLIIRNIKRNATGTYRCTASNGFGNTLNRSMHVNVTYPAQIENFQREFLVAAFQTVTLQCPADGNPPPKYTWTPCKEGRVCDEPKLNIGEVVRDEVYKCSVTNSLGRDAKNVTLSIAAKIVNVTLSITSEKCTGEVYDTSSVKGRLIKAMDTIFRASDPTYIGAEFKGYSCGSVNVYMALKFNSITKEKDVIAKIRAAVMNTTIEGFTFNASSITGTRIRPEEATTEPTSLTSSSKGLKSWMIILIVVGALFLIVLVGNICCWCFSATICIVVVIRCIRKCLCKEKQDSKEVHTNECQDTERDSGYVPVDHQYAVTGPNANYRASNPSSLPPATYEIANRESEARRGHGARAPREPLPEYAMVDKNKKKKKTPKPDELQYAELDEFPGRGKRASLPPVSGSSTVYAEVNQ